MGDADMSGRGLWDALHLRSGEPCLRDRFVPKAVKIPLKKLEDLPAVDSRFRRA
jgi:hypothetical protein